MSAECLFQPRNRRIADVESELRAWRILSLASVATALLMCGIVIGMTSRSCEHTSPEAQPTIASEAWGE